MEPHITSVDQTFIRCGFTSALQTSPCLRQGGTEVWFPDQLFPNKDMNVLFEQTLLGFQSFPTHPSAALLFKALWLFNPVAFWNHAGKAGQLWISHHMVIKSFILSMKEHTPEHFLFGVFCFWNPTVSWCSVSYHQYLIFKKTEMVWTALSSRVGFTPCYAANTWGQGQPGRVQLHLWGWSSSASSRSLLLKTDHNLDPLEIRILQIL